MPEYSFSVSVRIRRAENYNQENRKNYGDDCYSPTYECWWNSANYVAHFLRAEFNATVFVVFFSHVSFQVLIGSLRDYSMRLLRQ
jgi:hypothetical protein